MYSRWSIVNFIYDLQMNTFPIYELLTISRFAG